MRRQIVHFLAPLLSGLMLVGCERSSSDTLAPLPGAKTSANSAAPKAIAATGSGVISGRVVIPDVAPTPAILANFCDDPAHAPQLARAEQLIVNPNHTLRNVVVYVKNVSAPLPAGTQAALLDQVHCRYVPHVLAIQTGQELTVRSSDDTLHNVHMLAQANPQSNLGMRRVGESRNFVFSRPDNIPVKCDVHPWMLAHILVFDHPFFAVTGDDGSFTIRNLPAGTYTLAAWHERLGELEQTVTVADAKPATASFTYKLDN